MLSTFNSFWSETFAPPPFILSGAPVNTATPVASGSTAVGSVISVTNGTWAGTPTITYAYQWVSGSTNVGINSNTYTTVSGDSGALVYCKVTATNGVGNSTANSNSIGPIGAASPSLDFSQASNSMYEPAI
jgi:hypothetical protein